MSSAWLFDCYPHPRTSHLVVWIHHNGRATKRLVPYQPDFCIKSETMSLDKAERLLKDDTRIDAVWRDTARLWLEGADEPVLRVRPKRLQELHRVATDLRRATHSTGFLFFDVDHAPESRWMHAQGLWSMCRLHVSENGPTLRLADVEERFAIDYPDPDLTTLRLAVEVEKQGHAPDFGDPLAAIRVGDERIVCPNPGDEDAERDTLHAMDQALRHLDPDVIITKHGDRFDIPYLLHRIRKYDLHHQIYLGREPDPDPGRPDQQGKSIHTYGRWLYKTSAYYLRGRWHIDLSKKTLDAEDDRKDIHGILYLTRISNRRAQDINRNGAGYALQQMQIDLATDMGVALPWKRNLAEDWKDAATLCAVDRGGQIMNPQPGIYEDVAACDFSGYYPSLVVRHNLSSDTINCQCCPEGPVIPELGYHVCTKRYGHQAEILRRIWGHRRYVKAVLRRAKLEAQQ